MVLPRARKVDPKVLVVTIGVVVALAIGAYAAFALAPSSVSGSSSSSVSGVYSHTGVVGDDPTMTTPTVPVAAGSVVFLFVGYVNGDVGGGAVASVSDSLGDLYQLVSTTGLAENHTEDLYESQQIASNSTVSASVTFTEGDTPMGGAVALVDVVGRAVAGASFANASGPTGPDASLTIGTNFSGELVLFGISGQMKDTPFTAGPGENLLDTGNATSGPFEDGEGFATYDANSTGTFLTLSATLANPAVWNAIAVVLPPLS